MWTNSNNTSIPSNLVVLIYNENDPVLKELVEQSDAPVKRFPYSLPEHFIDEGTTYIETAEGAMPLQVFGKHNLNNLEAARWLFGNGASGR